MENYYDVVVIGAGPGGYVSAIRAAQLGLKTAIVEYQHLGGICLNWGCIPTKALLRSAEIKHLITESSSFGIKCSGGAEADIEQMVARSRKISQRLCSGVEFLLKKNNIDIIWGQATLEKPQEPSAAVGLRVKPCDKKKLRQPQNTLPKNTLGPGFYHAQHVIVATGARARQLPHLPQNNEHIWSYFEALLPKKIPESLLVLGSGAIGCEFASFYNDLGTKVTIIEREERILPLEDCETSQFVEAAFRKRGMHILTAAELKKVAVNGQGVEAHLRVAEGDKTLQAQILISAVGVQPNSENLGLEALGVAVSNGFIETDAFCRTNIAGIYAIGDVAGAPMLAHKAEEEGVLCAEAIAGLKNIHPLDRNKIPSCTYSRPQIASIGMTEQKAKKEGKEIRVGRYPFSANGKALALGEEQGFIKTIFDKDTGALIGAHMVGAEVTELIQGFAIAMNLETTEEELMQTIFPHPTLSEMMKESVLAAFDRPLNA